MAKRKLEEREVVLSIVLALVTMGIYAVYWVVASKRDIKSRGGDIPTCWLIIIPFANIYFYYKYCRAAARLFRQKGDWIVYFILSFILCSVIMLALVQDELNKIVRREKKASRKAASQKGKKRPKRK